MTSTASDGVSRDDLAGVRWHVSSRSTSGGSNCVEAGPLSDGTGRVAVRHSKHPDGPCVIYTPTEWAAFVAGVKDGEFNFGAA
ncbi:MAG: DUF397 domain-containing protein [Micromonosporaceae bacterium]|nr:DUF397 domain-containing protein [Micromonosporaceae bacterium]